MIEKKRPLLYGKSNGSVFIFIIDSFKIEAISFGATLLISCPAPAIICNSACGSSSFNFIEAFRLALGQSLLHKYLFHSSSPDKANHLLL